MAFQRDDAGEFLTFRRSRAGDDEVGTNRAEVTLDIAAALVRRRNGRPVLQQARAEYSMLQ
jgi:hypothetical protein